MSTFCASCCLLLENSAPKPHWLIFQYYLKVLIRYCHKSMFFSLNFDVWNIWGRTLGKCTILHSLGSPHWLSIFIHYLWAQSKHPVIQGSSVGTWVTCKMRDNHSSGLHNVAPDLSCSNATKLSKTLESSWLESSMNRRAWLATVHGLQRARHNWASVTHSGFTGGSDHEESACNMGGPVSILGLGRFLWKEEGCSLQCSCLENPMGRGACRAIVYGVAKSQIRLRD